MTMNNKDPVQELVLAWMKRYAPDAIGTDAELALCEAIDGMQIKVRQLYYKQHPEVTNGLSQALNEGDGSYKP